MTATNYGKSNRLHGLALLAIMAAFAAAAETTAFDRGKDAVHRGAWDVAERELLSAYALGADSMTAYLLCVTYANLQRPDQAMAYCKAALNSQPWLENQYREGAQKLLGWAAGVNQALTSIHVHFENSVQRSMRNTEPTVVVEGDREEFDRARDEMLSWNPCLQPRLPTAPYSAPSARSPCLMYSLSGQGLQFPILPTVPPFQNEVSGHVVTPDHSFPIPGAQIFFADQTPATLSAGDGGFSAVSDLRVLLFRKPGFRPLAKVVGPDVFEAVAELEKLGSQDLNLPPCRAHPRGQRSLESRVSAVRFLVPRDARVMKVDSAGRCAAYKIVIDSRAGHDPLTIAFGSIFQANPPLRWFAGSEHFSTRAWIAGDIDGLDARGRSAKATAWRWTGNLQVRALYQDVSEEAALSFDQIIDSACLK